MPDQRVLDRIDGWQAAGLIDDPTAERLRAAEASAPDSDTAAVASGSQAHSGGGLAGANVLSSTFGPTPSIAELFAYLGTGFVLVAWHVLVSGWLQPTVDYSYAYGPPPVDFGYVGLEWGAPAIAMAIVGWLLSRGDARTQRTAGVAFAVATLHVYVGLMQALQSGSDSGPGKAVLVVAGTALAALAFRLIRPALVPQAVLLAALVGLSASVWVWIGPRLFGESTDGVVAGSVLVLQLFSVAWWLATAAGVGLLARRELRAARLAPDPWTQAAAGRRATLTRFVAGVIAVGGTASVLAVTGSFDNSGLPVVVGDGLILVLSAGLLVLAARTASVYLYPAALGIIVALTSLNARYVAEQTGLGVALLVEGAILLGGGLFADRIRRRLTGRGPGGPAPALLADDVPLTDDEQATITEITPA